MFISLALEKVRTHLPVKSITSILSIVEENVITEGEGIKVETIVETVENIAVQETIIIN